MAKNVPPETIVFTSGRLARHNICRKCWIIFVRLAGIVAPSQGQF